jgi:hypothetical protein
VILRRTMIFPRFFAAGAHRTNGSVDMAQGS